MKDCSDYSESVLVNLTIWGNPCEVQSVTTHSATIKPLGTGIITGKLISSINNAVCQFYDDNKNINADRITYLFSGYKTEKFVCKIDKMFDKQIDAKVSATFEYNHEDDDDGQEGKKDRLHINNNK